MKSILITGASTGIGEAIAVEFAKKGWKVFAGVRKREDADKLEKHHKNIGALLLDVTKEDDVLHAYEYVKQHGHLNVLVNNAGIATGGPVEALDLEDWKKVFEVNLFGVVRMTKKFLPLLRGSKGRIINISSISGFIASPYMSVYSSSKFALEALSDSLRRELSDFGVRVAVIEPGPVDTPIWEKSLEPAFGNFDLLDGDLSDLYKESAERFGEGVKRAAENAAPVSWVVKEVVHAATSRKPKTRYIIAKPKLLLSAMKHLPDSLADTLLLYARR